MQDLIKVGDIVNVYWSYSDKEVLEQARVKHVPCDVGDMWYLETDGLTHAINPSCAMLESIIKVDSEQK